MRYANRRWVRWRDEDTIRRMKQIKEKHLDEAFSKHVRKLKNYTCERCGYYEAPPTFRIQLSHFHSRNARSVRFDYENVDVLCIACHRFLETRKTAEYRDWKLKRLGTRKFNALERRYYTLRPPLTNQQKLDLLNKFRL